MTGVFREFQYPTAPLAVFNEDVIRRYVTHLDNRRKIRPSDEYRPASTAEWDEFTEHFDKRKVELGSCGRPYGTPCQHEHACLSELAEHGCQLAFHLVSATESSCEEVGQLGVVGHVADYDRGVTLGRFLPTRTRFACEDGSVRSSYVIFLKGLVVTLGMVLGDFSSRASTRER
ncbi:hypothetical protein [Streptomyces sp. NBC_01020]|uniref:hypothetical protein n=1 Tax=Streptomyces sp. NBC_01020 TaxID=2903722 RepID=UPI00386C26E3